MHAEIRRVVCVWSSRIISNGTVRGGWGQYVIMFNLIGRNFNRKCVFVPAAGGSRRSRLLPSPSSPLPSRHAPGRGRLPRIKSPSSLRTISPYDNNNNNNLLKLLRLIAAVKGTHRVRYGIRTHMYILYTHMCIYVHFTRRTSF